MTKHDGDYFGPMPDFGEFRFRHFPMVEQSRQVVTN